MEQRLFCGAAIDKACRPSALVRGLATAEGAHERQRSREREGLRVDCHDEASGITIAFFVAVSTAEERVGTRIWASVIRDRGEKQALLKLSASRQS